jgi:hypothetical protein
LNVDEDLDALERAQALNDGQRRTPTIDLGVGGPALVEPDNDTLTGALVELEMLTQDEARELTAVQNVGDVERWMRGAAGVALIAAAGSAPRGLRGVFRFGGAALALSGLVGWCPVYHSTGVSSLDGPGDRPGEATRDRWLAPLARDIAHWAAERSERERPRAGRAGSARERAGVGPRETRS